jgi:hypothetical protein
VNGLANRQGAGRQGGAAAVEFAFVFPILFLLMYGVIVYAYIFVIQQSLHYAAQEGAEAAVKVDPASPGADALRLQEARRAAADVLRWLPADQRQRVVGGDAGDRVSASVCPRGGTVAGVPCPSDSDAMIVRLTFPVLQSTEGCQSSAEDLFPVLCLYLVGRVPPMPQNLIASAMARI